MRVLTGMRVARRVGRWCFVQLLKRNNLIPENALAPGTRVLAAVSEEEGSWTRATIVEQYELARTWTVRIQDQQQETSSVLPVGEGGVGGILRAAADQGEVGVVRCLLGANVSANEADCYGNTALHRAASHTSEAHAQICEMLVAAS